MAGLVRYAWLLSLVLYSTWLFAQDRESSPPPTSSRPSLGSAAWPKLPRQESLPFPPTPSASIAGRTMQDSVYKQRVEPRRLPKDAPNILIVLIDDVGPAQSSTFGGLINTPTMDRIAKRGIAYNRFHTTAMCSPTRAALLCGRNHHRVGSGQIAELANDWDGYSGVIPKSSATVAEVLKDYGYATSAFGKWHNTPAEQTTAAGPFEYLAHRLWLRILLRVPGGRSLAVRAVPGAKHNLRRTSSHIGRTQLLPLERRPGRRRDQLFAPAQGVPARQAVLHVLGERRCCTARTRSRRNGPTNTKANSTTAGTSTASAPFRLSQSRKAGFPPTPSTRRGRPTWPPGTASPTIKSRSSAA